MTEADQPHPRMTMRVYRTARVATVTWQEPEVRVMPDEPVDFSALAAASWPPCACPRCVS